LFGIPSTLSSQLEAERRQLLRDTYLHFDKDIYEMAQKFGFNNTAMPPHHNRVCSLQEWTCQYKQIYKECQIIYAFFVGDNADAPPYILDDSLKDFRSMLTQHNNATEPGLIRLNIRENQFDGKMTTWFQLAALVGEEFPEIDYAVKADSDTLVFTPNFLENLEMRHRRVMDQRQRNSTERIYGGIKYPRTFCGKHETHHSCPLPLVGDTYMSGELSFMSMDLAKYIASDACPRDNVTIPHEDVSLSNYVYSYTNNTRLPATISSTTIDRIFINQERILLTFNQSADWESRKNGKPIRLEKEYRKFLWGHCNPRPMKNDALYTYFKDPPKVRKIWKDFLRYYYQGVYGGGTNINNHVSKSQTPLVPEPMVGNATNSSFCAILLFGLPRSFKRYVLPSIIRNVILPNMEHGCDFFVHYYHIASEEASRSGNGGNINPDDVLLLQSAIHQVYNDTTLNPRQIEAPTVSFVSDTNETFWEARGEQVITYRTSKKKDGTYLYYPFLEQNYIYPSTMDNIVKQWHSINAVWEHMETKAKEQGKSYHRVSMLRSDVIFLQPIDIYRTNTMTRDVNNEYITIPDWAGWPVNDRMVNGPYDAVKVWATERFSKLTKYVRTHPIARMGYGMQPEKFLKNVLLQHLTQVLGYKVDFNKQFCFVRVRADGGIWIDDCNRGFPESNASAVFQQHILPENTTCERITLTHQYDQLYCNFKGYGDDLLWNLRERPMNPASLR
jgi:hypothetical protein